MRGANWGAGPWALSGGLPALVIAAMDVFPIYHGPLGRGNHRIDISSRVALKQKDPLPLNESAFRLVNNSFNIDIPDGKFQRRWVVDISPAAEGNGLNVSFNEGD